ncbi:uncharacterized protein LOC120404665 isoform X5 [Mauremys reevesii]|uniref:uncharacterized protein LOC120404665 isoform X5 n=1 Tax=Mauremys reevesii TaxID=260615 RepID=UPI00193EEED4|nr:uncharacterized protein LOC120404665 isoform X5 [Mauremys reevesii]
MEGEHWRLEKPVEDCAFGIRRPIFISPTPGDGDRISVLPYEDVSFTVMAVSTRERMADLQVLGPYGLRTLGPWMADDLCTVSVNITWESRNPARSHQVPVCFVASTLSGLQSELRCIWIVQKAADYSQVTGVFVTCDVKLCRSLNRSRLCPSGCRSFKSNDSPWKILETKIHRITAGPIQITKGPSNGTNYAALVVGIVLGCTVVCIVFLLLKKSFVGVPYRNVSLRI